MELKQLQTEIDAWIQSKGVRYFNELTNLGILMEEVGELSRHMVRIYGEQSYRQEKGTIQDVADEMADILWVLAALTNQCGVDLSEAMRLNMEKKNRRDAERHQQNPKL